MIRAILRSRCSSFDHQKKEPDMTTSGMYVAKAETITSLRERVLQLSQAVGNARIAEASRKQGLVKSAREVYESVYGEFLARREIDGQEVGPFTLGISCLNLEITELEKGVLYYRRRKKGLVTFVKR